MSKEDGRGVNSRGVYDPRLEQIEDLVDKVSQHLTADEVELLANVIDEGNELYLMDTLIKKAIEKDPAKADNYVQFKDTMVPK